MWQVGLHARGVAFGMVCLACLFIMLSIGISWGINKGNYDTPTPVRHSIPFLSTLSSLLTLLGSVLVRDQSCAPPHSHWWRIHLAVDRIVSFGSIICPTLFPGGRSLVC